MENKALLDGFGKLFYKNDKHIDYEALRLLCNFAYDTPTPKEHQQHICKMTLCMLTISNKYEYPIAFLKGNRTLADFGIRNGSSIIFRR